MGTFNFLFTIKITQIHCVIERKYYYFVAAEGNEVIHYELKRLRTQCWMQMHRWQCEPMYHCQPEQHPSGNDILCTHHREEAPLGDHALLNRCGCGHGCNWSEPAAGPGHYGVTFVRVASCDSCDICREGYK